MVRLTQPILRELLHYDHGTGDFTNLITRHGRAMAGSLAGSLTGEGYWNIMIFGSRYQAHRLAWLYMTGKWPENEIDHKDLNKSNNRWHNLREATCSQNHANKAVQANNSSGFKGVSWNKKKWRAVLYIAGKQRFLGYFDTPQDAHIAYCNAAKMAYGDFARTA